MKTIKRPRGGWKNIDKAAESSRVENIILLTFIALTFACAYSMATVNIIIGG